MKQFDLPFSQTKKPSTETGDEQQKEELDKLIDRMRVINEKLDNENLKNDERDDLERQLGVLLVRYAAISQAGKNKPKK